MGQRVRPAAPAWSCPLPYPLLRLGPRPHITVELRGAQSFEEDTVARPWGNAERLEVVAVQQRARRA